MTQFAFQVVKLGATILTGIDQISFERRHQMVELGADGNPHTTSVASLRMAPKATFRTAAMDALANVMTLSGATYYGVPYFTHASGGAQFIGDKAGTVPGWAASTVHAQRSFAAGLTVLSGIDWSAGDIARMSCDSFALSSDGSTTPITETGIAAVTPVGAEQMTLQSATVAGVDLTTGAASLRISVDHRVENNVEAQCFKAGLPYPVALAMPGPNGPTRIEAEFETTDLTTALTAQGDMVFVFAVITARGIGLSATTLTVTLKTGYVVEESIPGERGQAARRRIRGVATFDGTNQPLTLAS